MTAAMSWNRIACARAFSSDMWLTPKNWLSPNSSRSMCVPGAQALGSLIVLSADAPTLPCR